MKWKWKCKKTMKAGMKQNNLRSHLHLFSDKLLLDVCKRSFGSPSETEVCYNSARVSIYTIEDRPATSPLGSYINKFRKLVSSV